MNVQQVIFGGDWGTVSAGKYCGRNVAIKELNQEKPEVDHMKHEAYIMAGMDHPNIVTFIGAVFSDATLPMIVMELMEENLRVTYNENTLSRDQMFGIFKDVAYALNYLHKLREPIVHRNVSADVVFLNLLPNNRYRAKVSGFETATFVRDITVSASTYSAPEFQNAKQIVKIDSYGYGMLICEVINRKRDKRDSSVQAVLHNNYWRWMDMSNLVSWCIECNPEIRPTMEEILHESFRLY